MNTENEPAIGVDSFCKNKKGMVMISKYISYNRPYVAAVTMIQGPWILKKFSGAWNVKYVNEHESELIFTYNFEIRGKLLGRLILPFIRYYFAREMEYRLKAFKCFIEK